MILCVIDVARLMYCGQGSKLLSSCVMGCTWSLLSIGGKLAACSGVLMRRRGVPMISRSIRRCVRASLVVESWVVVQLLQP